MEEQQPYGNKSIVNPETENYLNELICVWFSENQNAWHDQMQIEPAMKADDWTKITDWITRKKSLAFKEYLKQNFDSDRLINIHDTIVAYQAFDKIYIDAIFQLKNILSQFGGIITDIEHKSFQSLIEKLNEAIN